MDWDHLEDTLTAPRLEALNRYWIVNPPVHLLVKAFTGYKPPEGQTTETGRPMTVAEFFQRIPKPVATNTMGDLPPGTIMKGTP